VIQTPSANRARLTEITKQLISSWKSGDGLLVEHFQNDLKDIGANIDEWYDLVIREIQCRRSAKQSIIEQDYYRRFPWLRDRLNDFLETKATAQVNRSGSILPSLKQGGVPEIDGYRILSELGRGGMGVVYKAIQIKLNRTVALKVMLSGSFASGEDRERFRLEVESTAQLQHENIVQVFEVGEVNGFPYCALEYVEGGTLAHVIQSGVMNPRRAAEIALGIASGAQEAHDKGIIHRDLKPSNVLLSTTDEDAIPKITDFGIAKRYLEESNLTGTGIAAGTPQYMSPEQAIARKDVPLGPGVDIYATGIILYEMLTGKVPFDSENPVEVMQKLVAETPTAPHRFQPKIPRDLETICLKCLEKNPQNRYLSASGLVRDLERFLKGMPVQARRINPVEQAYRWCRRNPVVAGLMASTFFVLFVGVLVASVLAIRSSNYANKANTNAKLLEEKTTQAEKAAAEAKQKAKEAHEARILEKQQREDAEKAQNSAEKAEAEAIKAKTEAQLRTTEANRLSTQLQSEIYSVKMALAHSEYQSGQIDTTTEILNKVESSLEFKSMRGFEWYYLRSLVKSYLGHQLFQHPQLGVHSTKESWFTADLFGIHELNMASMKLIPVHNDPLGLVISFAVSPDGRYVAVGEKTIMDVDRKFLTKPSILIIDRQNPKLTKRIQLDKIVPIQYPTALTFDATGKTIYASVGSLLAYETPGRLFAIDREKGELIYEFTPKFGAKAETFTGSVNGLALAAGGKYLIAGDHYGKVAIFDTSTREQHHTIALAGTKTGVISVSGAADKPLAAIGTTAGSVVLIDLEKKEVRNTLPMQTDWVDAVTLSADGRYCASGGSSGIIKICDCVTGLLRWKRSAHNLRIAGLCFGADGKSIGSAGDDRVFATWDHTKDEFGGLIEEFEGCWNQIFPTGKQTAVILDELGGVHRYRFESTVLSQSGTIAKAQPRLTSPRALAVSMDPVSKTAAFVWTDKDRSISWHSITDENLISFVIHSKKGLPISVAVQPGGKCMAVATQTGAVEFISGYQEHEKRTHTIKEGVAKSIQKLIYSPDGKKIAIIAESEIVMIDEKGDPVSKFKTQMRQISNLCFSPDGTVLAVVGSIAGRGIAQLWNVKNGTQIGSCEGHNREVLCVAFSPDGKRLVTGGFDTTLRLWDTTTHRMLLTLTGHSRPVESVCFVENGQAIVSSSDNESRFWDARIGYRFSSHQSIRNSPQIGKLLESLQIESAEAILKPDGNLTLFWELANLTDKPIKFDPKLGYLQGQVELEIGPSQGFPDGRKVLVGFPDVPVPPEIPPGGILKFQIEAGIKDLKLNAQKGHLTLRWSDGTVNTNRSREFKVTPKATEN